MENYLFTVAQCNRAVIVISTVVISLLQLLLLYFFSCSLWKINLMSKTFYPFYKLSLHSAMHSYDATDRQVGNTIG